MRLDPGAVAEELRARGLDGWLLYDFRGQNGTALGALGLEGRTLTRRWFYLLPARGEPTLIVHAIERGSFPALPGRVEVYAGHVALGEALARALAGARRVAMEYSPLGAIPTLSRVDAGTVERVRALGAEVVSSADLVQHFLCRWDELQLASHVRAVACLEDAKNAAFAWVAARVRAGAPPLEIDVQRFLLDRFRERGMTTDHPPIVAAGRHSGDPHYAPELAPTPARVREGDVLLLDLWCKENDPRAAWGDITWMGFVGAQVPPRVAEVFAAVAEGRDLGLETVRLAHADRRRLEGWQVDRAVRDLLASRGLGERFLHRTGHSIGDANVHGDGANLDDFETHDTRALVPGLAFSIEPGAYLDEFGVRSEIDVYLGDEGPRVFSPIQRRVIPLLGPLDAEAAAA